MKKLFVLALVLLAVAFAGKVFLEKRYERELDKVISFARGFVDIRYDAIKIGFDSSISINGLRMTPAGLDETLSVRSIKAVSSDRLFPIKGHKIFKDRKFPETFEVTIDKFSMPVGLVKKSQKTYFNTEPSGEECRSLETSVDYANAGYSKITSDTRMAFDFSDVYNAVVNVDVFDQTSSVTLEWIFDASNIQDLFTQRTSELPVNEINATFELEPDAAESFIAHCADVFSLTPELYLEKVVGSAKYSENSFGTDLGPQMREALMKFMKGGSQLSINSKPSSQLKNLAQLQFFKAKDVVRWMNLTLTLDGEVLPLSESVLEAELASTEDQGSEEESSPVKKSKYFKVSPSNARNYIGHKVRIKRSNQRKSIDGRLSAIKNDRLEVNVYQFGGAMMLSVGVDEIVLLEVRNK